MRCAFYRFLARIVIEEMFDQAAVSAIHPWNAVVIFQQRLSESLFCFIILDKYLRIDGTGLCACPCQEDHNCTASLCGHRYCNRIAAVVCVVTRIWDCTEVCCGRLHRAYGLLEINRFVSLVRWLYYFTLWSSVIYSVPELVEFQELDENQMLRMGAGIYFLGQT